ncbi:MAG: energy-coupling factor transporter transmembrane component T family protein [Candidatus Methanofastidiosia archaeon]
MRRSSAFDWVLFILILILATVSLFSYLAFSTTKDVKSQNFTEYFYGRGITVMGDLKSISKMNAFERILDENEITDPQIRETMADYLQKQGFSSSILHLEDEWGYLWVLGEESMGRKIVHGERKVLTHTVFEDEIRVVAIEAQKIETPNSFQNLAYSLSKIPFLREMGYVFWILLNFIFYSSGMVVLWAILVKFIGLRGFQRLLTYEKRGTAIHKLDPRTKLAYILSVGGLAAMLRWELMALILLLTLIFWYFAKPSKRRMQIVFSLGLSSLIFAGWGQSVFFGWTWLEEWTLTVLWKFPPALHRIGVRGITLEGFFYGLSQGFRLVAPLSAVMLILMTTYPSDILLGLSNFVKTKRNSISGFILGGFIGALFGFIFYIGKLYLKDTSLNLVILVPFFSFLGATLLALKWRRLNSPITIGLPSELAFGLTVILRFIPKFMEDAMIVINAEKARGWDISMPRTRNPITAMKAFSKSMGGFSNVIIPVVISSLRSGKNLAVAADTRAFRAKPERTHIKEMRLSKLDKYLILLFSLVFIFGMIAVEMGWGAPGGGITP